MVKNPSCGFTIHGEKPLFRKTSHVWSNIFYVLVVFRLLQTCVRVIESGDNFLSYSFLLKNGMFMLLVLSYIRKAFTLFIGCLKHPVYLGSACDPDCSFGFTVCPCP